MRLPLALLLLATSNTACPLMKNIAPTPCETPPPIQIELDISEQINPDARGRSLPTVVQILQLKDSSKLERAGFRDLWGRPKEFLGDDLLQTNEYTVDHGKELKRWIRRDPKAHFILAMGHFRQPLGYSWRTVMALDPVPEPFCYERTLPAPEDPPKPGDVQLHYRLQGYQIDLLRPQATWTPPAPASALAQPGHPKGSA